MKRLKKFVSPALLVLAALIWGLAFSAQKSAEAVPPFTLGAARSVFAFAFLTVVIIIGDKITKNGRRLFSKRGIDLTRVEIIGGIICGAVLAIASFFQQLGMNEGTDAGKSAFITALYVVIVPIYGIALKRRAPLNVWISMPFAVVGFYLLCIKEGFYIAPSDVFVIICALIFPIHILAIDRFSPSSDGVRMSAVQFLSAAVINAILALIFESPVEFGAISDSLGAVIYLGIGSSGIAYTLQIIGQRGTNPAAASILLSLESVFGVLGAAVILSEKLLLREYIGCAIVFVAVLISELDLGALLKRIKAKNEKEVTE